MSNAIAFTVISVILALGLVPVIIFSSKRKDLLSNEFLVSSIFCLIQVSSYLVTVFTSRKELFSIFSTIYFICFDLLLLYLFSLLITLIGKKKNIIHKLIISILGIYALFEVVIFIINIFVPFVIDYAKVAGVYPQFVYVYHPLYYAHLAYTYLLVAISLGTILYAIIITPNQYADKYIYLLFSIGLVVAINALFLFLPDNSSPFASLDIGIFGYPLIILSLFFFGFLYGRTFVTYRLRQYIINNLEQGIVLFDYNRKLITKNKNAEDMLLGVDLDYDMDLTKLFEYLNYNKYKEATSDILVFKSTLKQDDKKHVLRCEVTRIKNKKQSIIGYLFSFTDLELENDILTGLPSYTSFQKLVKSRNSNFKGNAIASFFDIAGLNVVNQTKGREEGDDLLRRLADILNENFSEKTYISRYKDANFCCITQDTSKEYVHKIINRICVQFNEETGQNVRFIYGSKKFDEKFDDFITRVYNALLTKKMLDSDSSSNEILNSLVNALREIDSDTNEHVKRTQTLGALLGEKIGLSAIEQANLSLLCILHDIGKIGIPLEILNKPAKLNDEEWRVMQSHSLKGYHIANSSPKLAHIADAILHHHERWDGKGYPDGLSKESIPLLSRIVSLVDSYDAMTHDRPYKKAKTVKESLDELRSCSGTQFDPRLTNVFIKMISKELNVPQTETVVDDKAKHEYSSNNRKQNVQFATVYNLGAIEYKLDSNDTIISCNDEFYNLTGYTPEETIGKLTQNDLIPEVDRLNYFAVVSEQIMSKGTAFLEHRLRKKDGTITYVYCVGRRYYDSAIRETRNDIILCECSSSYSLKNLIIQEEKKASARLRSWEKIFRQDSLTGLLSHNSYQNDVEALISLSSYRFAFAMVDLDHFKQFNDKYGHKKGDEYLINFAHIISSQLEERDIACRMGGDEFSILFVFNRLTEDEDIKTAILGVFSNISSELLNINNSSGCSMGVAIANEEINSFDKLYESADSALYNIKRRGRGKCGFYN